MRKLTVVSEKDFFKSKTFIQENKDDFYISAVKKCMDDIISRMNQTSFEELEDVSVDNLRLFWLEALKNYENERLSNHDILNIVDSFEDYMNRRFENDYPEFEGLIFPNFDVRSIGLNATQHIKDAVWNTELAPQFIKVIKDYLQTPLGQQEEANLFMDELFAKLETKSREKSITNSNRDNTVTWEELQ